MVPTPGAELAEAPTTEAEELPELVEVERELARRRLHEFRRHVTVNADGVCTLVDGWWQREAAEALERFFEDLLAGRRPKLILQTPPQHGKSHMIRDFVAWCLGRMPDLRVAYASYSDELGVSANIHIQRLLDGERYRGTFPDTRIHTENVVTQAGKPRRNQKFLEIVGHRGSFRNTTIQGPLTGQPADLGVIDDPVKDRAEAESDVTRAAAWDWFNNVFLTRLSKTSGYVIILTRWHLDDLAGRLLVERGDVRLVTFKAVAEEDEPPHRKEGEALFPELQPLDLLMDKKATMRTEDWGALFQQEPVPRGGVLVKDEWFPRYAERGQDPIRVIQSWDCASKVKDRSDPSACLTAAEFADRIELWWSDVARREFPDLLKRVKDCYGFEHMRGPRAPNVVLIEDKDSGQAIIQQLRRDTKLPVIAVMPRNDKPTRLMEESATLEAMRVHLPKQAPWLARFLAEALTFPSGAHDDQVDTLSQLLWYIRTHPARISVPGPVNVMRSGGSIRRLGSA
jgi:predicted phage terminase large subunit-like protein